MRSSSAICSIFPRCVLVFALALACLFAPRAHADADANADADRSVEVRVQMRDDEVIVDANCYVRATPQEAWAVMIDFDHATEFVSKLERSVVFSRTEDTLVVSQKGWMGFGPFFSLTIETITEVRLIPNERMEGRLISGNMKKNESTTTLVADGTGTRIHYHLESIPEVWMPPIIGRALVEYETRARFEELLDEILRRKALAEAKR